MTLPHLSIDSKSLEYLQKMPNVSRETLAQLQLCVDHTVQWQQAINLISPATVNDIWWRHIVDSAQLSALISIDVSTILDIGSGGGFPGLVLAIMHPAIRLTLVESDKRKCIFLQEMIRIIGLKNTIVQNRRIETLPMQSFDLITARALASVEQLLTWATPYGTHFLFPKGENAKDEVIKLGLDQYKIDYIQSVTDEKAHLLQIEIL